MMHDGIDCVRIEAYGGDDDYDDTAASVAEATLFNVVLTRDGENITEDLGWYEVYANAEKAARMKATELDLPVVLWTFGSEVFI